MTPAAPLPAPPPVPQGLDPALLEIGRLTYVWTNTESLLVHLIAGLSGTDKDTALIVFLTLNTTRARVDLVERLAKHRQLPEPRLRRILDATRRLVQLSGERNRYNHAIYAFDPRDGDISTIQMRIADRGDVLRIGRKEPLDRAAIAGLRASITDLAALNREIWAMIAEFGYPA